MDIPRLAKTNAFLLVLSSAFSAVLIIGAYEIFKNIEYYSWKENFDNTSWLGKVTIPSPNPVLMWEYRPNGEFEQIKTNRYGFRDIDYESTAKPDNIYRIAFAGDSVTLGLKVDFESIFVRQFEAAADLRSSKNNIQALNFAVDGYNTPQISEMVRTKVLSFSPDKVVYVMCLNDFDFETSSGDKIYYFMKPRSFFLLMLENYYKRYVNNFYIYHFNKNKNVVFNEILSMNKMSLENGADFQVAILPIFPKTFDNRTINIHNDIALFLKDNGIQFIDLHEDFRSSGQSPRYYAHDPWHPNARGHKLIADALLPSVLPIQLTR